MPELEPGAVFAGHRIEGVAGRGGVGVVYRARHLALDHLVALKVISPGLADDPAWRARFVAESRAAVSIRHPNVVAVHHAGEEDGVMFVTMDLIDGVDLRRVLREGGPLSPEHAVEILTAVASALDAAHEKGLVHRDVKPSNILIELPAVADAEGPRVPVGGERVYLTDFGLTKRLDSSADVTASGAFVGTIDYVAPEQIQGERVDARTDVYALGCVLYETISGQAPFARLDEKVAKLYAHLEQMPEPLSELRPGSPRSLDRVVERAMAKQGHDRYRSAGDLARAAQGVIEGVDRTIETGSVATGAAAPESSQDIEIPPEPPGPPTEAHPPPTEAHPPPSGVEQPPTQALRRDRRASRTRAFLLGVGALVVVGVVLALVLGGGGGSGTEDTSGGGGGEGGAGGAAKISLTGMPVGIGVADEGIWVGRRGDDSVTLIDPKSMKQITTIDIPPANSAPEGVTVGPASIWVALQDANQMARIDRDTEKLVDPVDVGDGPRASAHQGGALWVTNGGSDSVTRVGLEPGTGAVTGTDEIPVGASPQGIVLGDKRVWVTNRDDDTVSAIDDVTTGTASVLDTIDVGDNPKGIAFDDTTDTLWVADTGAEGEDDGTVTAIDAKTMKAGAPIDVGGDPRGVAVGFGSVWVANGAGYVSRIDPANGTDTTSADAERIPVGQSPEEVATGSGAVWVTDGLGSAVYGLTP